MLTFSLATGVRGRISAWNRNQTNSTGEGKNENSKVRNIFLLQIIPIVRKKVIIRKMSVVTINNAEGSEMVGYFVCEFVPW